MAIAMAVGNAGWSIVYANTRILVVQAKCFTGLLNFEVTGLATTLDRITDNVNELRDFELRHAVCSDDRSEPPTLSTCHWIVVVNFAFNSICMI